MQLKAAARMNGWRGGPGPLPLLLFWVMMHAVRLHEGKEAPNWAPEACCAQEGSGLGRRRWTACSAFPPLATALVALIDPSDMRLQAYES